MSKNPAFPPTHTARTQPSRPNSSFASLSKFFKFSKSSSFPDELDSEQDDHASPPDTEEAEDEQALMWDAQIALIEHQPNLAMKLYAKAALPPHASPAACLALGNLLIRGSAVMEATSTLSMERPVSPAASTRAAEKPYATSFWSRFFAPSFSPSPSTSPSPSSANALSPPLSPSAARKKHDLIAAGWHIPREGKRAVRDVEGMGVAGAWFVLGLGWAVERAKERQRVVAAAAAVAAVDEQGEYLVGRKGSSDEEAIVFGSKKGKGKGMQMPLAVESPSTPGLAASSGANTSATDDSIETPREPAGGLFDKVDDVDAELLSVIYELLRPLLRLYRHGHIQSHDPVALPPISLQQLPPALKPRTEMEKGRNVWALGRVVCGKVKELGLVCDRREKGKGSDQVRKAVMVLTDYILAMTCPPFQAAFHFRHIASTSLIGLEVADDLIVQAGKRLKTIVTGTPRDEAGLGGFPFPALTPTPKRAENEKERTASITSLASMLSPPRILHSTKSTASLVALADPEPDNELQSPVPLSSEAKAGGAVETLKRVQVKNGVWDGVEISAGEVDGEVEQGLGLDVPNKTIRAVASSPQLPSLLSVPPSHTNRRRLPFEPSQHDAIMPIDPALAEAERRSALTKNVKCGVCMMKGVNFPECRRCGMTFCGRECRVGEEKAGNGKRHICGAWESRKLLSVPTAAPGRRSGSNGGLATSPRVAKVY
ncbi:hypothetical protein L198_01233 [Cryptococcus wingfieldii CBS 7118]|uniref:Uncharacterized protein n=1 Tax=Cryptococcus wingfieldii CBS 7118 TaxID=1295528 RepID=A0A1E3K607_9TREE|nr:hypothetical protein L198_01233 [Cryptococcus wingfieldii CBS 7118]ODO07652.1 hypothetical protein L198_01233 [Cryptococcus wingfieldii CBS 7118]